MKTLTIKNPWAYLIAAGIKDVENRTWQTSHRGKILIHSSKSIDSRFRLMNRLFTPAQWGSLSNHQQARMAAGVFDVSSIIGEVEIVDCIKDSPSIWAEPFQWHWILKNPVLYEKPIPNIKGKLSFWHYPLNDEEGK